MAYKEKKEPKVAVEHQRQAVRVATELTPEDYERWQPWGVWSIESPSNHGEALITALAHEGTPESIAEVISYIDHDDDTLVVHAVSVLAERGITEAVEQLQHRPDSLHENDTWLREKLREAIDQLTTNTKDE